MYRRVFLTTLAGGLLAAPLAAEAQQTEKVYRVGILTTYPVTHGFDDFVAALRDLGYVEGQNLALEIRSANNIPERVPALAVELVRLNVGAERRSRSCRLRRQPRPAWRKHYRTLVDEP
jgi:putative ABC transport system substrate-binding protein